MGAVYSKTPVHNGEYPPGWARPESQLVVNNVPYNTNPSPVRSMSIVCASGRGRALLFALERGDLDLLKETLEYLTADDMTVDLGRSLRNDAKAGAFVPYDDSSIPNEEGYLGFLIEKCVWPFPKESELKLLVSRIPALRGKLAREGDRWLQAALILDFPAFLELLTDSGYPTSKIDSAIRALQGGGN